MSLWRVDELSDGPDPDVDDEVAQQSSSDDEAGYTSRRQLLKPQAVKVLREILSRPCGCNSQGRPKCLEEFPTPELHNATVEQMVVWHGLHKFDQLICYNCRT